MLIKANWKRVELDMDFNDFRAQFPLVSKYTYLNHAVVAPLPTCVVQAMKNYLYLKNEGEPEAQEL